MNNNDKMHFHMKS